MDSKNKIIYADINNVKDLEGALHNFNATYSDGYIVRAQDNNRMGETFRDPATMLRYLNKRDPHCGNFVLCIGFNTTYGAGLGISKGVGIMIGFAENGVEARFYLKAAGGLEIPQTVSGSVEIGIAFGVQHPKQLEGLGYNAGASFDIGRGRSIGFDYMESPGQYVSASFGLSPKLPANSDLEIHFMYGYTKVFGD